MISPVLVSKSCGFISQNRDAI